MTTYIDFAYYSTVYGGTAIPLSDFDRLALLASASIDQITLDRAAAIVSAAADAATVEKIKLATCAAADELKRQGDAGESGRIKAERVGQHSVTYVDDTPGQHDTNIERIMKAAKPFLGLTGLMYKGFYSGEYGGIVE